MGEGAGWFLNAITGGGTYQRLQQSNAPAAAPVAAPAVTPPSFAEANASGRGSTILTSGQGDTSLLTNDKKKLLGVG